MTETFVRINARRAELREFAERHGWTNVSIYQYHDRFERTITLDADEPMAKVAASMGWELKESLYVGYTHDNRVHDVAYHSPADQAALDGRFVTSHVAKGTNKREQAFAHLAQPAWTPARDA
ncbi:hypothetical protein SEA_IKELOA_43 [Mycobacterium phage IkeLoa]|nr:hypothetical protein SEA_IKELOA_43 [Mycobacterium phage IkeLoa]